MNLIVFAHKAEAQNFLKEKTISQYSKKLPNLYHCDKYYVLFLGKGIGHVTRDLASATLELSGKIKQIINMGVAGSLSQELELNKIYPIKTCILAPNDLKRRETFDLQTQSDKLFTCITTQRMVDTPAYAKYLHNYADLVDMELWAISAVCHQLNMPLSAYKLISDYADNPTITKSVKQKAPFYSSLLKEYYTEFI